MAMNAKRSIMKKSANKGVAKSAAKTTLGNSNKAIRDGAGANARMGKKGLSEVGGFVVIEGKLTADEKTEVLAIARNTGKTGPRDAERVTKIDDKPGKLTISTSGSELAVSIGKRVHHAHKGGKLTIVWGHEESPVRVHWMKK
jgi:hypothetical protein